jgi:hypothetical protein
MDYVVEVRVYRHNEHNDLPVPQPNGLATSTTVRFVDLTNALRVAERATKPLRAAQETGTNMLAQPVKPGPKPKDAA